jgi:hypothetical protein
LHFNRNGKNLAGWHMAITTVDLSEHFLAETRRLSRAEKAGRRLVELASAPVQGDGWEQFEAALPLIEKATDKDKAIALETAVRGKNFELSALLMTAVPEQYLSPQIFTKKNDDPAPFRYSPLDLMLENDAEGENKWENLSRMGGQRAAAKAVPKRTQPK